VPSSMKSASVYLRRGVFYVHPLAGSQGGDPCLFTGPVLQSPEHAGAEALGSLVRQAVEASHHHAPWPTDWKGLTDPLLAAASVKSMATFMKGATHVRVDVDRGELTVTPTTTKEHRNAFSPLKGREIKRAVGSDAEWGKAVVHGFAMSD